MMGVYGRRFQESHQSTGADNVRSLGLCRNCFREMKLKRCRVAMPVEVAVLGISIRATTRYLPDRRPLSRKQTRKSFVFWHHLQRPAVPCSESIVGMRALPPGQPLGRVVGLPEVGPLLEIPWQC
jgi:hypothetical protein